MAIVRDIDPYSAVMAHLPPLEPPLEAGIGELGGESERGDDHDGSNTNPRLNRS
jgi:hypothetical protein